MDEVLIRPLTYLEITGVVICLIVGGAGMLFTLLAFIAELIKADMTDAEWYQFVKKYRWRRK